MEMLSFSASDPTSMIAKVIGSTFVARYYQLLPQQPELGYKFYKDSSFLRHPDSDGTMTTVTTLREINNMILSFGYENYKIETKTMQVLDSYQASIMILVTGCLSGTDNRPRKFMQSFTLAPQAGGYFVQNSIFNFIEESEPSKISTALTNAAAGDIPGTEPLTLDQESARAPDHSAFVSLTAPETMGTEIGTEETLQAFQSEHASSSEKSPAVASDLESIYAHREGGNQVYLEIIRNFIYIYNLDVKASNRDVMEDFEKFGEVKRAGVYFRKSKDSSRTGFVEFKSFESVEKAIKASPITIGGRRAIAEVGSSGMKFETECQNRPPPLE